MVNEYHPFLLKHVNILDIRSNDYVRGLLHNGREFFWTHLAFHYGTPLQLSTVGVWGNRNITNVNICTVVDLFEECADNKTRERTN